MYSNNLKRIREEFELTQKEMAKILNVTRSAYSLWEINKNIIPLVKLNDFCNHFNLSMDYCLGISNDKKNNFTKITLDKRKIGKRIKQTRKELNLTQEKLAKKFNTTHSAISAYENGITMIPTIFLVELARISNKSIDYLCGRFSNALIKM